MATPLTALDLRVSMIDALADLVAAYEVSDHSPRTISMFSDHVSRLAIFLAKDGVTTIDEVTTAMVTRFLAAEKARDLKPASLSISLRTLRTFFAWCVDQGHLTANPARSVKMPRVVIEPPAFMADEQIAILLSATAKDKTVEGVRDGALFRVLRDTGVRRGELIGMRVEDVDLDTRQITIRAITSKNRKGRVGVIAKDTQTALRTYLRVRAAYLARMKRSDDGMLWIASKGDLSGNGVIQGQKRRLRAAGLPPASIHQWRHRWAATAFQQGLALPYIINLGGWANAVMPTSRYGMHGVQDRALTAQRELLDR